MSKRLITFLKKQQPTPLQKEESKCLWQHVASELEFRKKKAPFAPAITHYNFAWLRQPAFAFAMGLLLVFTGSYTAQAADNAGPGDLLYPVDLTMEKIHLAVVAKAKREPLRYRYALERVDELETYTAGFSERSNLDEHTQQKLEQQFSYVGEYLDSVQDQLSEHDRERVRQKFSSVASSTESLLKNIYEQEELEDNQEETESSNEKTSPEIGKVEQNQTQNRQQSPSYAIENNKAEVKAETHDTSQGEPKRNLEQNNGQTSEENGSVVESESETKDKKGDGSKDTGNKNSGQTSEQGVDGSDGKR